MNRNAHQGMPQMMSTPQTLARLATVLAVSVACLVASPAPVQAQGPDGARAKAARVLSMFSHEPTIIATQETASKYAMNNPGVYSGWLSRAAAAFALPDQLRGRYVYILDDDLNLRTTELTGARTETKESDLRNAIEVQIEWDLSKLVYNPEEYKAADKIGKIVERREDLLLSVNKLYFSRRRLQAELVLSPPSDAKTAIHKELAIAALTADLDALTGGWFTQEVAAGLKRKQLTEKRPAPIAPATKK